MTKRDEKGRNGVSRRDVLKTTTALAVGAAIGTMGFPAIVRSQEVKRFLRPIVAGLNGQTGDPTVLSISEIPRILREKYDVELEIQVHPSSSLGTDVGQLEAVQTGFIDITSHAQGRWSTLTDAWDVTDLPYALADWDMAERFFKSDLFKQQAARMEAQLPIKVLPAVGAGGFRMLSNNKRPIKSIADAAGLKVRSAGSPASAALADAWGMNPTPIAWTETYTALQQGTVEGFHVQPIWTFKFNMFEVLDYAVEVGAIFGIQIQAMNINTFNAMPEEIQKAFMLAAQDAADIGNSEDRRLENFFKDELRTKGGMEIYTPSERELAAWRAPTESIWGDSKVAPAVQSAMRDLRAGA